ncbi:MAG: type VI secretion system contractile sheath protein TssC [Dysgonomonas sp.]
MAEIKQNMQANPTVQKQEQVAKQTQFQAEDAIAKLGGFGAIKNILPDAENLDFKSKAQRNIFLGEQRFAGKREKLASDLKKWIELLDENKTSAVEYAEICSQKEKKYKDLFSKNLSNLLEAIAEIEREYRTLDAFFKNSGSDKIRNLRLINVDKNELNDSNSEFIKEIADILKNAYDRLSLKDSYSLMVMPGYIFEDNTILRMWAKLAHDYKVMLVSDHADETSFDNLVDNTDKYRDSDGDLQNIILAGNWLLGRRAEELAAEEENFYIPPSGALAGMMYNESKNMAQGAAGKKHGTLSEIKGVRLDLLKTQIAALMDKHIIPMVFSEGRVMAFNDTTLFNGDNKAMQSYPIVRIFDWIKKVMMNFLNDEALQNWDTFVSPDVLKEKIQAFLNVHKGYGKLFQDYKIGEPRQDPETKNITVDMEITPYFSAKNFIIKLSATKGKNAGFDKNCEIS